MATAAIAGFIRSAEATLADWTRDAEKYCAKRAEFMAQARMQFPEEADEIDDAIPGCPDDFRRMATGKIRIPGFTLRFESR